MSQRVPFTAYFKMAVVGQSRLERLRYMAKIAYLLYQELAENTDLVLALPGGGQFSLLNMWEFTDYVDGMASIPQFGEAPAQLRVAGFYTRSLTDPVQPYANRQLFHAGRAVYGQVTTNNAAAVANPTTQIATEVRALKTAMDVAVTATNAVYADALVETFRIDYNGIVWGDRGFHFPVA